jgi:two-component system, NarL family, sensor kinase
VGNAVFAVPFLILLVVGAFLAWRRPANSVGWLLGAMGAVFGFYLVTHEWAIYALDTRPGSLPAGRVAAWLAVWTEGLAFALAPFVVAAFPTGRIIRPLLARLAKVARFAVVGTAVALAFTPRHLTGIGRGALRIPNPVGVGGLRVPLEVLQTVSMFVLIVFVAAAVTDLADHFRHATGDERVQLRWVAAAVAVIPGTFAIAIPLWAVGATHPWAAVVIGVGVVGGLVAIACALAVSVLKYRLYELGDYVRRAATQVVLTGLVAVGYFALVSLVGVAFGGSVTVASVVATAVVVVTFGPLRGRLQGGVDRLLFGRRSDPYGVVASLGARLEATLAPDGVLPAITESIATVLRLPYVAVTVDQTDGAVTAQSGPPPVRVTRLPLVYQHERLGELVIGHRSGDESFSPAERELLENLSRQAAVAVHAVGPTEALRLARDHLVRGREEERRRLRRDLHDGVGPTLAGLALQLEALGDLIDPNCREGHAVIERLNGQLRHTVDDVRRLVQDLRPPAIDELGLLPALRHQAATLTGPGQNGLRIDMDLPSQLPELPAAVEVAVFRVASEALTNVVRHAHASRCTLRLTAATAGVALEITDDGIGIDDDAVASIGLASMRDRASELGGTVTIEPAARHGTRVQVHLPTVP